MKRSKVHVAFFLKLKQPVLLVKLLWHVWVWMMLVEELNGMESTAVNVEVDVATVEIRSAGFPHLRLRMQYLDGFPDGLSDALALNAYLHIEECQFIMVSFIVDYHNGTAHTQTIFIDSFVGFSTICFQ